MILATHLAYNNNSGLCWADAYYLEPVEGGPGCLLGLCRNEDIGDLTNKNGVKNKQANMGI